MTRPTISDQLLEAVLRERAGSGAPSDLRAGIMGAIAAEQRRGRPAHRDDQRRFIRLLAVAAVLATTAGVATLVGAGRAPDLQVSPSVATEPSVAVEPSIGVQPSATEPSPSPGQVAVSSLTGLPALTVGPTAIGIAIEEDGRILVARYDDTGLTLTRFERSGRFDVGSVDAKAILADRWDSTRKAFVIAGDGTAAALHDLGDAGFDLVRYRSDGSVDEAFGEAGHVRSTLGHEGAEPVHGTGAMSLAVGPDGAVFVVGGSGRGDPEALGARYAVARFTPDGTPDPAFGTGGQVFLDLREGSDVARAIAVADDGRLVVVGETGRRMAGLDPFGVVRLTPGGAPDTTFGTDGIVLADWCCANDFSVATLGDGSIVVAGVPGQVGSGSLLARFRPDGSLDPTFGDRGLLVSPMQWTAVAVGPDGGIVVAGIGGGLTRFLPDGTVDGTFDTTAGWP